MTVRSYHRPTELDQVWSLLRDGGDTVRLLGGGTDLVVACPPQVETLVDLAAAGLDTVEVMDGGGLRLGAMATFTELLEHPAVGAHATGVLADALGQVGSVLHRNSATVGGHIARGRMSDVIPVLLALDAVVVTYDGDQHEVPLGDYHAGPRQPHVITEVRLPALPGPSAAAFLRFSRTSFDHAILNACCRVDLEGSGTDTTVAAARVVVGETAVLGRRVTDAEAVLVGGVLDPPRIDAAADAAEAAVEPRGDWIATADYRRHLVGVAVRRGLTEVAARLGDTDGHTGGGTP
jgi:aerobic carbon-monoxide dehydrogenase medium subunit